MLHSRRRTPSLLLRDLPIQISGYEKESIVDGPGLRFVLFVQGCPHHCMGCHNPQTHPLDGGVAHSTARLWDIIQENPLLKGITFSGGEPFLHGKALAELGRAAHQKGLNVMTYSGYTYEALLSMAETDASVHALLCETDYLVDGPYIESQRDLNLAFRGSANQRILEITCYPNSRNATVPDWL